MLDSHIISASFLKHSQVQVPVEITFQHLNQDLNKRICVFWDVSEENWSEKGCQLIQSNQSHTQCGCQHLTHFALLALVDDPTLVGSGLDFGLIQANEGPEKEAVITLEIATYLVSSICLLILLILSIQVRNSKDNWGRPKAGLSIRISVLSRNYCGNEVEHIVEVRFGIPPIFYAIGCVIQLGMFRKLCKLTSRRRVTWGRSPLTKKGKEQRRPASVYTSSACELPQFLGHSVKEKDFLVTYLTII